MPNFLSGIMGNSVSLEEELINLRMTSKQMQRASKKCEKNEKAAVVKVKKVSNTFFFLSLRRRRRVLDPAPTPPLDKPEMIPNPIEVGDARRPFLRLFVMDGVLTLLFTRSENRRRFNRETRRGRGYALRMRYEKKIR